MTMDPLRQSIDLSRLVIAKEFLSSPAKAPVKRSPHAPPPQDKSTTDHAHRIPTGGHLANSKPELLHPPSDAEPPSPQPGGWPLRLSNIANRLTPSPIKKRGGYPQSVEQSPESASPSLSTFLQESPALFSEPREAARRLEGGNETVDVQGGVRGSVTRALRFGGADAASSEIAPVPRKEASGLESERLTSTAVDSVCRERTQGDERGPQGEPINLTPLAEKQTHPGQPEEACVNRAADTRFVKSGLLPAPPKRTPPLLRKTRTRNPFTLGANQPQPVGVNKHKTPVGWVGFDETRAENDENRQQAWALGVRNVTGLQIRTVVRTGEAGGSPGTAKSPLGCFGGARLEVSKRSPIKSKAVLRSPLGGRDVSDAQEGSTRLAGPTREPFQQVSENAVSKGDMAVKGKVRFEEESPKKLRSPGKPFTLGRPSPLGKGCFPSPTKPLTSALTSPSESVGQAPPHEAPCVLHVSTSGELPPAELKMRPNSHPESDELFAQTSVKTTGRSETPSTEPVGTAGKTEVDGGGNVSPKSGPHLEDSEFRAGLAALRKLKLESEQGLITGSSELAGEVPPWERRRSVSGSLTGSFDTGDEKLSGAVDKESKVPVGDGGKEENVVKVGGKGKWGFGFGRSGKKSVSAPALQEEDVGFGALVKKGAEQVNGKDGSYEAGRGVSRIEKEGESLRLQARDDTDRRECGDETEIGKQRGAEKGADAKSKRKKRKDKRGPIESGAETAPTEGDGNARQPGEQQGLTERDRDDVSGAPKRGLLRKALRLKRSKKGKAVKEEVADGATEAVTRGEPAMDEEAAAATGRCHVAYKARAKDTPVKITLEGVKIVVRPKDGDVSTPNRDEGARQADMGTPAEVTSAAGAQLEAAPFDRLPVPTTDDKLRLLAAALERAHQSAPQTVKLSPQKATTFRETALPRSPRFSPCATSSPQLLSLYGRSPVGSAERLEEVRQRMEARARVLGDQGHVPRAARRLQMDGAVAANGIVTVGREGLSGESVGPDKQESKKGDAFEHSMETEEGSQQSPRVEIVGDEEKCSEKGADSVDRRADSAVEKFDAAKQTEEANGTERAEDVKEAEPSNPLTPADAASFEAAGSALNPQSPPAAAQAEAPEAPIVPESEETTAAQEVEAAGIVTAARAAQEVEVDDVMTSANTGSIMSLSPPERCVDSQREPGSPEGPFGGAAAFFRGVSFRPVSNPPRGLISCLPNGLIGSTGHRDRSLASTQNDRLPGTQEAETEADAEVDEKASLDTADTSVGKGSGGWGAVTEGDLLPVEETVGSPARRGDKSGADGAERSPEETFRGAAAFFLRASVTPNKVPASNGLRSALREDCLPAAAGVSTARSASDERSPVPVESSAPQAFLATEPDQNGAAPKRCDLETPPKRDQDSNEGSEDENKVGGSVAASLQGVAHPHARNNFPEERLPNAAAFFGRRAAATPVAPRVTLPLQELRGFANRANEDGSGKENGLDKRKAKKGALTGQTETGVKTSEGQAAEQSSRMQKSGTIKDPLPLLPLGPSVLVPAETPPSSPAEAPGLTRDVTAPVGDVTPVAPAVTAPEMPQGTVSNATVRSPEGQHQLRIGIPDEAVSRLPKPDSKEEVPLPPRESERDLVKVVGPQNDEHNTEGRRRGSVLEMVRQREAAGREKLEDTTTGPAQERKSPVKVPTRQIAPDAAAASAAAAAASAPQLDALMRENERLKAQVVLLQEEKHRIAKQMEASSLKANGNAAFAKGKFDDAKRAYNRALELRVNDNQFNAVIYTNRAAANLALGATMDALADCAAALRIDPKCAGAVLRKVDACLAIGDWQAALSDLSALEKAGTGTEDVRRKMHDLKAKMWRAPAQLDFYGILELSPRSNTTAVKNAYKRLALRYHPDRAGPHADLVFQYVARAYQVLSNPVDKKKYDAQLQRALQ
ncbi:chaperone DnaJ-domain superfamily protein [Klebsormidium nitens]|uniref:Chaperone DnaJ-domain superfamily protein n=1 Tax=Klebsormidium nitens TaxID=105231 RepID=A0A1Y1I0Y8_KLENI|nr:chaperone DnaJ-domain superfamily protein [Klebsormidium nitens]|eukprot:GAQ82436.1 chaperone DnaJ-domain superfamily protein [Klebsormidium nitens]